ncbi:MAG: DNA polymerase III subunit gamma/tau [Actinomycetota bacterium]|nr:DNA polymerase III subunit gamma/tau [Actinomycetota bacterium]
MAYISLYRKWRPQTFEEVVGQVHITRTLANAIQQNRVAHAYLFCGPRGTGKTTVAKIVAKAVNCAEGPTPIPCNNCHICEQITNGSCVDVLEIDAASNRGIDEIRDLREKVHFAPTEGRKKVYIIDEVHMLTLEAFNALLKTLEEPPSHVIFILATTEPHKVLPTILSRCQKFDFRRILVSDMVKHLRRIADAEEIKINEAALPLIAKQAQGSLRDAIGTLDQLSSFTGKNVKMDDVTTLLGLIDLDLLFEITDIISRRDITDALFFVDRLLESGRDIRQFTKELTEYFRNLFLIQNAHDPDEIINTTPEAFARMQAQVHHFQPFEVVRFMEILSQAHSEMRWNPNARLLLEMALVKTIKLDVDLSLEGLLYRIEELEKRIQDTGYKIQNAKLPGVRHQENKGEIGKIKDLKPQQEEVAGASESRTKQPAAEGRKVSIEKVKRAWPVILERVKKKKIPTYALLLECKPSKVEGEAIILEFSEGANFHKNEVEKPPNLAIVQQSLKEILEVDVEILCMLEERKEKVSTLKDEIDQKDSEPSESSIVKLVQDSFDAEVIDEFKET